MRHVAACCIVVAAIMVFGSTAYAAPPTLHSVGHDDRHPTATFVPVADSATIYMASKPDRATDGSFLSENVVDLDFLDEAEAATGSWFYETQLESGTYYLMLHATDLDCVIASDVPNSACIDGYSNVMRLSIPLPTLTVRSAKSLMRDALEQRFGGSYSYGNAKRLSRCSSQGRYRVRCARVSWFVGDTVFRGSVTARHMWRSGSAGWRVTGRIRQINEYCKVTGGRRCTKVRRVNVSGARG